MYFKASARWFTSALRRAGERITVIIDGVGYRKKAVIQNAGKNFMRKYDDEENTARILGRGLQREKICFMPFFDDFNATDGNIYIKWRGRKYLVLADSVLQMGDEPFGIWALLKEVNSKKEDYYGNNIN